MNALKAALLILTFSLLLCSCRVTSSNSKNDDVLSDTTSQHYSIVDNGNVALSSFNVKVPDDLSLTSSGGDPVFISDDGELQIMIIDKTQTVADLAEYINKVYAQYSGVTESITDIERIQINSSSAKRFSFSILNEEKDNVTVVLYFWELNGSKIEINVMKKGNSEFDLSEIDKLVASLDFS